MLQQIEPNKKYISESGFLFRVIYLAKHGQDCSHPMVVYTNLEPTADQPAGQIWTIAESIFLKRFSVPEPTACRLIGVFDSVGMLPPCAELHDVALIGDHGDKAYVWTKQDAWTPITGDIIDVLTYSRHPDCRRGYVPGDWQIIGTQCWVRMQGAEFKQLGALQQHFDVRLPSART